MTRRELLKAAFGLAVAAVTPPVLIAAIKRLPAGLGWNRQSFTLTTTTLWVRREKFQIEFLAYETMGDVITMPSNTMLQNDLVF
jgi:hypothetical protein